jgi:hypothetical protein
MTKLLRSLIDEENQRRGKKYPEVGALTTFTRGFGLEDDVRIAEIVNAGGGVATCCLCNVRSFRKYLARERKLKETK